MPPIRVPSYIKPELEDALARARSAGAKGDLDYVGAGAYGIVFCDDRGHAWKVFRSGGSPSGESHLVFLREAIQTEYEWLKSAQDSTVSDHVARVFGVDLGNLVLERECVEGYPGGWSEETMLWRLHKRISEVVQGSGWMAPEFKADSYVITPSGNAVLVDASMAIRTGSRLLEFVKDVLDGRRASAESPHTLAFYVLREVRMGTITKNEAAPVIGRLVELDPSIAEGFSLESSDYGLNPSMGAHVKPAGGGLWMKGRRYQVDISKNRKKADVRDSNGRPLTSLDREDMEDLLAVASNIRGGRPWEKSGRFVGDTEPAGSVIVDTKHGIRMKAMSVDDVAELVLISEEAVLEMA